MDVKRLNELYKKEKEVGLTEEEKEEQKALRREYINSVLGNVKSQLGDPKTFKAEREKILAARAADSPDKNPDRGVNAPENSAAEAGANKGDKTEK